LKLVQIRELLVSGSHQSYKVQRNVEVSELIYYEKRDGAVAYCEQTSETAALVWKEDSKKNYVLTNAFLYSQSNTPLNVEIISVAYHYSFNTADR
jgi:hypothetical protein